MLQLILIMTGHGCKQRPPNFNLFKNPSFCKVWSTDIWSFTCSIQQWPERTAAFLDWMGGLAPWTHCRDDFIKVPNSSNLYWNTPSSHSLHWFQAVSKGPRGVHQNEQHWIWAHITSDTGIKFFLFCLFYSICKLSLSIGKLSRNFIF